MLTVTVEDGTGRLAQVEGYEVAGKTGTAQKAKEGGGYYDGRYIASFVGMVPQTTRGWSSWLPWTIPPRNTWGPM